MSTAALRPVRLRRLLPALALLAACGCAAARTPFEERCIEAARDAATVVTTRENGWRIDNTVSYRQLTQMKRTGVQGGFVLGLIVGLLARFLKPGDDSMGWIMTILLGIAGSLAATYGGQALGIYQAGQGAGFLGALVGAIILLVIYGMVSKKR